MNKNKRRQKAAKKFEDREAERWESFRLNGVAFAAIGALFFFILWMAFPKNGKQLSWILVILIVLGTIWEFRFYLTRKKAISAYFNKNRVNPSRVIVQFTESGPTYEKKAIAKKYWTWQTLLLIAFTLVLAVLLLWGHQPISSEGWLTIGLFVAGILYSISEFQKAK